MDRGSTFSPVVDQLSGSRVRCYDRRGYGRSAGLGVTDVAGHARDVVAVLAGQPALVVGHSLGGVIALTAAEAAELVAGLVVYEAPMQWRPWWPAGSAGGDALAVAGHVGRGPADVAERFVRNMVGDARWESLSEAARVARRAEGPALVVELEAARRSAPYAAERVAVPVVAGYGTASKPYHQRAVRELAAAVAHGELVAIDGARHAAHQTHPEAFAALVRRGLARLQFSWESQPTRGTRTS